MRWRTALTTVVAWTLAAVPPPTPAGPLVTAALGLVLALFVGLVLRAAGLVARTAGPLARAAVRTPDWLPAGITAVLAATAALSLSASGVTPLVATAALGGSLVGALAVEAGTCCRGATALLVVVTLVPRVDDAVGDAVWWVLDSGPAAASPRLVLTEPSPLGAVRIHGDDVAGAVDGLERAGGLLRPVVVVALPTGSGWVDPDQVAALEEWAGGDVTTVTARYSRAPSAAVYVLRPERAEAAARELLGAVLDRVERRPVGERPRIVVHGQSLGAWAGARAVADLGPGRVDAVMWQGSPGVGRSVPGAGRGDDAGTVTDRCVVDARNADDPVVHLHPDLLWDPRARTGDALPWLPVVSFLRVAAALPGSLDAPAGRGHRYRPVLPPEGCAGDAGARVGPGVHGPGRGDSSGKSPARDRLG